jgi:hypothetical protein
VLNRTLAQHSLFFFTFTVLWGFSHIVYAIEGVCDLREYSASELTAKDGSRIDEHRFEGMSGKQIRSIDIVVLDIFDLSLPEENTWLYRKLNQLQRNTRDKTIRRQLLFREGDMLDEGLVEETERLLNRRDYVLAVAIVPTEICEDSVDVAVLIRDAWVLEPQIFYGRDGGEDESGFGIKDGNFLGSGDAFSISYKTTAERNSIAYRYLTRRLFNRRIEGELLHEETSDGHQRVIRLEKSFFSLRTPWAMGASSASLEELRQIRFRDEEVDAYVQRDTLDDFYAGVALSADSESTQRLRVGVTREHVKFSQHERSQFALPQDRSIDYVWAGYEFIENRFGTYKNLNQIQRVEHLALGTRARVRLGYGSAHLRQDMEAFRLLGRFDKVIGQGDEHIVGLSADLNAWYYPDTSSTEGSVVTLGASYNLLIDPNNRWFVSAQYSHGDKLQSFEQLTIGGSENLRGYPLDYQRGNQRYVLKLERRHYTNIHLFNLIRVGTVLFLDAGQAWGGQTFESRPSHLADLGVGLRLTPSKLGSPLVLRLDLAKPLMDREHVESSLFSLSVSSIF